MSYFSLSEIEDILEEAVLDWYLGPFPQPFYKSQKDQVIIGGGNVTLNVYIPIQGFSNYIKALASKSLGKQSGNRSQ